MFFVWGVNQKTALSPILPGGELASTLPHGLLPLALNSQLLHPTLDHGQGDHSEVTLDPVNFVTEVSFVPLKLKKRYV